MGKSKSKKITATNEENAQESMHALVGDIQNARDAVALSSKLDNIFVSVVLDMVEQHDNSTNIKKFPSSLYITKEVIDENNKTKNVHAAWKRAKVKAEKNSEDFDDEEPECPKETRVHIIKKMASRSTAFAYIMARLVQEFNDLTEEECYDKCIRKPEKLTQFVMDSGDDIDNKYFLIKFLLSTNTECDGITEKVESIISKYVTEKVQDKHTNVSTYIANCMVKCIAMCARNAKASLYACHPFNVIKTCKSKEGVESTKTVPSQSVSAAYIINTFDIHDTDNSLFYDNMSFIHAINMWYNFHAAEVTKERELKKDKPAKNGVSVSDNESDVKDDDSEVSEDSTPKKSKKPKKKAMVETDNSSEEAPKKKPSKKAKKKVMVETDDSSEEAPKKKPSKKASKKASKKTPKVVLGDSSDSEPVKAKKPADKKIQNIMDDLSEDSVST